MFEIGDYVVNATNGICRIIEIVEMDLSGDKVLKPYFLLVPVDESSARVYIPVDTAQKRIRRAISRQEALAVIDRMDWIGETAVRSEKERENTYKEAIKSCDPEQLISILKTLCRRKRERLAQGKKCTAVDERYYKMAEKQLYAEFAFALGRSKNEMEELFAERVELCGQN